METKCAIYDQVRQDNETRSDVISRVTKIGPHVPERIEYDGSLKDGIEKNDTKISKKVITSRMCLWDDGRRGVVNGKTSGG